MGYCIDCEGVMYSCGYTRWENFREEVALTSIAYIQNEYDVLLANGANESHLENQLSCIMEYLNLHPCRTIPEFMQLFSDMDMLNTFIYYNMSGVYALLNKSDDDGYYSVGNASDIAKTLLHLMPYMLDDDTKKMMTDIQKVFETSVLRQTPVAIY